MLDRILQFCKDEGKRDKVFQCVAYTFLGMLTILILFFRTFFAMPDWLDRLYINFTVATLFVAIVLHAPEIFKDRYLLILAIGLTVSLITSYCIQGTAMEYIRNTLFFFRNTCNTAVYKIGQKGDLDFLNGIRFTLFDFSDFCASLVARYRRCNLPD